MDAGLSGVVAMRYNVDVETAATFVAALYEALVNGSTLGETVTRGRKQLHTNPERTVGYTPRTLQDWCVPVVHEVEPLSIFPPPKSTHENARAEAAGVAFNLGHAYMEVPSARNLATAEARYQRSLDLHDETQLHGRARCPGQLGNVAYERFQEARAAKRPDDELIAHINTALQRYLEALELLPGDAVEDLAVSHHQLGNIFGDTDNLDNARHRYQEAIRNFDQMGDLYRAGQTRFAVALNFARFDRFEVAQLWAQAALRNFETFGDRAAYKMARTKQLLADIGEALKK